MPLVKELVLRKYGDHGADVIDRLIAQVEYTADLCIRMLTPAERIDCVLPEWIEDVTVVRGDCHELIQVKTRDEGRGPWLTREVVPILCSLYHRRRAVDTRCTFRFVSDRDADPHTAWSRKGSLGPLYRLKLLLDLRADGQTFQPGEQGDWDLFRERLAPKLVETLRRDHKDRVTTAEVHQLLDDTVIETGCVTLRKKPDLDALHTALQRHIPDGPQHGIHQLRRIFDRLVMLILDRVREGRDREGRRITVPDVLGCTQPTANPESLPDLDLLPGGTRLEKKTLYGGFHATEMPLLRLQRTRAQAVVRELDARGDRDAYDAFYLAALNLQVRRRRQLSRDLNEIEDVGPAIMESMDDELYGLARQHLPPDVMEDAALRTGILWLATEACHAWWHRRSSQLSA